MSNIMKSIAGLAMIAGAEMAAPDALAADGPHVDSHSHNQVYLGVEGSSHHGALQAKYMKGIGGGSEFGAALSMGLDSHKNVLMGAEVVLAYKKDVSRSVDMVLEIAAGMEAVKGAVHGVEFEPLVKAALSAEIKIGHANSIYAGPYIARVGDNVSVGGVAGVAMEF